MLAVIIVFSCIVIIIIIILISVTKGRDIREAISDQLNDLQNANITYPPQEERGDINKKDDKIFSLDQRSRQNVVNSHIDIAKENDSSPIEENRIYGTINIGNNPNSSICGEQRIDEVKDEDYVSLDYETNVSNIDWVETVNTSSRCDLVGKIDVDGNNLKEPTFDKLFNLLNINKLNNKENDNGNIKEGMIYPILENNQVLENSDIRNGDEICCCQIEENNFVELANIRNNGKRIENIELVKDELEDTSFFTDDEIGVEIQELAELITLSRMDDNIEESDAYIINNKNDNNTVLGNVIPEDYEQIKYSISEVYDTVEKIYLSSKEFFQQDEDVLYKFREIQRKADQKGVEPRLICSKCKALVHISARTIQSDKHQKKLKFFTHKNGSGECEIKNISRIDNVKYANNESERHKEIKRQITELLINITDEKTNICNIEEELIIQDKENGKWRKADIYFEYENRKIVIEIQLSSIFPNILYARDLFYKKNGYHLIWIFNFEKNKAFVTENNVFVKDVFYLNKQNLFIFDNDCYDQSVKSHSFFLKCKYNTVIYNELMPSVESRVEIIPFNKINFDNQTLKAYYYDSENEIFSCFPDKYNILKDIKLKQEICLEKTADLNKDEETNGSLNIETLLKYIEELQNGKIVPRKFVERKKYGYKVENDILIEAVYNDAFEFSSDANAIVKINRKYGLLNIWGKYTIPPEFHQLIPLSHNHYIGRIYKDWFSFDEHFIRKESPFKKIIMISHDLLLCLKREQSKHDVYNLFNSEFKLIEDVISIRYSSCCTNNSVVGIIGFFTQSDPYLKEGNICLSETFIRKYPYVWIKVYNQSSYYLFNELEGKFYPVLFPEIIELNGLYLIGCNNVCEKIGDNEFTFLYMLERTYKNGMREISLDGYLGVIDHSNTFIIKCNYSHIEPILSDNQFICIKAERDGKEYLISMDGAINLGPFDLLLRHLDGFIVKNDTVSGVVDYQLNYVFRSSDADIKKAEKGYIIINDGKFGFLNIVFSLVLQLNYDNITELNSEYLILNCNDKNGVYCLSSQKIIIPIEFDSITKLDRVLLIKKDQQKALVSFDKENCFIEFYDEIGRLSGLYYPVLRDSKYGLLDKEGKCVIPTNYDRLEFISREGVDKELIKFIKACKEGEYDLYRQSGESFSTSVRNHIIYQNGYVAIQNDKCWSVINGIGIEIFNSNLSSKPFFINNFYLTRELGICKMRNCEGSLLFEMKCDKLFPISELFIRVGINNKLGLFSIDGECLLPCKYHRIYRLSTNAFSVGRSNNYGLFIVGKGMVTSLKYQRIYPSEFDLFAVKKLNKYGCIDSCGTVKMNPQYKSLIVLSRNSVKVKKEINSQWVSHTIV